MFVQLFEIVISFFFKIDTGDFLIGILHLQFLLKGYLLDMLRYDG